MACSYHNQDAGLQNAQTGSDALPCASAAAGSMEQYPVGMGYVPWQQWRQTYSLEQGLNRGTIFADLDLTFQMGRCL